MAVRYKFGGTGALVTNDAGTTWKLLCNSLLFDPDTTRSGAITLAADGTMFVAGFPGMWHDDGHRCAWSTVPEFATEFVAGFTVDPIDSTITYAVTSTGSQQNGVMRRDGSGAWSAFGTKDDILISDIRIVAHGSGRRIYLGATKGVIIPTDGGPATANNVIRMSDDDGVTWTEHVYGSAGPGATWRLQAVDPKNPDRVVASIERPVDLPAPAVTTDTVLVSTDQGATFTPYLTVTEIGGVAMATDGRVWIGDAGSPVPTDPRGVWFAASVDVAPTKLSNSKYPVQCLQYQESTNTLYACQHASFGTVNTTDGSFTTALDLRKVPGFVECTGVDMAATCETQLCRAYCGVAHFAEAPVCCAYSSPSCGPLASPGAFCPATGTNDAGTDGASDASAGGAPDAAARDASKGGGGSGGITADGGAGGSSGASSGGASAAAGASPGPGGEGGCCSVAGRQRSSAPSAGAIALIGAALALRRRRRGGAYYDPSRTLKSNDLFGP